MFYVVKSFDRFGGTFNEDPFYKELDGVYVYERKPYAEAKVKSIEERFAHSAEIVKVEGTAKDGKITMTTEAFEKIFRGY